VALVSPELWTWWERGCTCPSCDGAPHDPPPVVRRRVPGRRLRRSVVRWLSYIGGRWAPVPMDCGVLPF